jgi:hypothetical protein
LSRCSQERPEPEFTEEAFMPLIEVRVIEGVFTEAQKRQIVHRLTVTDAKGSRLDMACASRRRH